MRCTVDRCSILKTAKSSVMFIKSVIMGLCMLFMAFGGFAFSSLLPKKETKETQAAANPVTVTWGNGYCSGAYATIGDFINDQNKKSWSFEYVDGENSVAGSGGVYDIRISDSITETLSWVINVKGVSLNISATIPDVIITLNSSESICGYDSLNLNTDGGYGATIARGTNTDHIIRNYGDLKITGWTIDGENVSSERSAIYNPGTMALSNTTIINCKADVGAAILNDSSSTLTISDGTFSNNTASDGGVIYNADISGAITISGGTFSNNTATSGGVIYNAGAGAITISGGTFTNTDSSEGKFVYNAGTGAVKISGTTVSMNETSKGSGGSWICSSGDVTFDGTSGTGWYSKSEKTVVMTSEDATLTVPGNMGNACFRLCGGYIKVSSAISSTATWLVKNYNSYDLSNYTETNSRPLAVLSSYTDTALNKISVDGYKVVRGKTNTSSLYLAKKCFITLIYNSSSESTTSSSIQAIVGEALDSVYVPTNAGYTFDGYWTTADGGVEIYDKDGKPIAGVSGYTDADGKWIYSSGVALYAHWIANPNTAYKIEHYQMTLDGSSYELFETENLTGATGTMVTATNQTYEGFTYDSTISGTITNGAIDGNGTLTLKLYYKRNQYELSLKKGSGITSVSGAGTYYYGEKVTISAEVSGSYIWKFWAGPGDIVDQSTTITIPAKNLIYVARAKGKSYTLTFSKVVGPTATIVYTGENETTATYTFGAMETSKTLTIEYNTTIKVTPSGNYDNFSTTDNYKITGVTIAGMKTILKRSGQSASMNMSSSDTSAAINTEPLYGFKVTTTSGGTTTAMVGTTNIEVGTRYYMASGQTVTVTATPDAGYIPTIAGETGTTGIVLTKEFTTSATEQDVAVSYAPNAYTIITADAGDGVIDNADSSWTIASDKKTATKTVLCNSAYDALPVSTRTGYSFNGWKVATDYVQEKNYGMIFSSKGANYNSDGEKMGYFVRLFPDTVSYTKVNFFTEGVQVSCNIKITANMDTIGLVEINDYALTKGVEWDINGDILTIRCVIPTTAQYLAQYGFIDINSTTQITSSDFSVNSFSIVLPTDNYITSSTVALTPYAHYLFAQWTVNTYSVVYKDVGGGDYSGDNLSVLPTKYVYGDDTMLPDGEKVGYTFIGWYKSSTGSVGGDAFSSDESLGINCSNLIIYAEWSMNQYTLTIELNGGYWSGDAVTKISSITQDYGTTITIGKVAKNYYDFTGWTLSGKGSYDSSTNIYTFGAGNGELIANWFLTTYFIKYYESVIAWQSQEEPLEMQTFTYLDTLTLLDGPTKQGYVFAGWHHCQGEITTGTPNFGRWQDHQPGEIYTGLANYIYLYAKWTGTTHSITYNYSGGKLESGKSNPTSYTTSLSVQSMTLTKPIKAGYSFGCWTLIWGKNTLDEIGPSVYCSTLTIPADYYGNIEINVGWSVNSYTCALSKISGPTAIVEYTNGSGKQQTYTFGTTETEKELQVQYGTLIKVTPSGNYDDVSPSNYKITGVTIAGTKTCLTRAGSSASTGVTFHEDFKVVINTDPLYGFKVASTSGGTTTAMVGTTNIDVGTQYYMVSGQTVTVTATPDVGYIPTIAGETGTTGTVLIKEFTTSSIAQEIDVIYSTSYYKITADADGGVIDSADSSWTISSDRKTATKTVTYGQAIGSLPIVSRTGYTYTIWSSNEWGITEDTKVTGNFTIIKPYWNLDKFTISVETSPSEYGSVSKTKFEDVPYGSIVTISDSTITINGENSTAKVATSTAQYSYAFTGWSVTDGMTIRRDITITANFVKQLVCYAITYLYDGGGLEIGEYNPTSYTFETETFTLINPIKSGYVFVGWTGSNGETAQKNVSIEKGSTGNKSYTANWKVKGKVLTVQAQVNSVSNQDSYNVSSYGGIVKINAGESGSTVIANIDYGSNVTLTAISNSNCTFDGWYMGDTCVSTDEKWTFAFNENEDITYVARFNIKADAMSTFIIVISVSLAVAVISALSVCLISRHKKKHSRLKRVQYQNLK